VRDDQVGPVAAPASPPCALPQSRPRRPRPAPVLLREATPDAALQLLTLLQREARLIDFAHENLAAYADADIGAAARVVHEGCARVLREHFTIEPVRSEPKARASRWRKASTPPACA
jgi:hypothetical protein